MNQLNKGFKDAGLSVLAVNVNKPNIINQVRPYIKKRKYKFDVAVDPSSKIAKQFKVMGYPTFLLIDKQGKIIHKESGYEEGTEDLYLKKLTEYYDKEKAPYIPFSYTKKDKNNIEEKSVGIDF